MFLTASGLIYERLYLITLGATCRYIIVAEDGALTLTDPGASVHIGALQERLARIKLPLSNLKNILLTHLDADRVAGLALLRRAHPHVKVFGTPAMHSALSDGDFLRRLYERDQEISSWFPESSEAPLPFEEFKRALTLDKMITEGDSLSLDEDMTVRCLMTPGHRAHSVAYIVTPHQFAIVDETFGYYRGRLLTAPGGDTGLNESLASVRKLKNVELSGIGFSYGGAITGSLSKRHIESLIQNTQDLENEVAKARKEGFSENEIEEQVLSSFYSTTTPDPCLMASLRQTHSAVMQQLSRATS
jgi:glyoxylase-like metal-dependent hydrolase (beta-lactamase superfamily II)